MKNTTPLQRRTPMRAGTKPMNRGAGFQPAGEAKPAKGEPRQRKCAVKGCQGKYTPDPKRAFVRWCSPEHGEVLAKEAIAAKGRIVLKERRQAAKAERLKDGERRESLKSRQDWAREAQAAVNAYVRERDRDLPCVSCGRHHEGQYHAGHYLSRGAHPHLAYVENNLAKQCMPCNVHLSGNQIKFRAGLVARIGLEAVEALEADQTPRKHTIEELREIRDTYRRRVREMKKEAACNP